jgi:predicted amidohydrolase YtcJ
MLLLVAIATIAPVDLVIENARIWSDGITGFAEFAAVEDGRFVYVGERRGEYVGGETVVVDAGGKVVLPGLIDSHIHMIGGGLQLSRMHLREATSKADFIARVRAYAESLPAGRWVLGGRYSTESWANPEQPTKEWVDAVTGDRPLWLDRMDGHSGLANSAALKIAGITRNTPDPAGGVIDRDANGEPTGILRENATLLVEDHSPAPTDDEKLEALRLAIAQCNSLGITSVSDIPGVSDLPIYERLSDEAMRFCLYLSADDWPAAIAKAKAFKPRKGFVEVRGLKAYMDGSLGSRTAYMHEPFDDNEPDKKDWAGLSMPSVTDGTYLANFKAAKAAGLQPIFHAIGDRANSTLLDFTELVGGNRPRSEHAQHLRRQDIARFAKLGVIASMQPYHKADDGRYAESRIGLERSKWSYAFKSLLDVGAVVAFGSDWPVVSQNPFLGVEAAVTGSILSGGMWMTHQNVTVGEALRGYTSRAAFACGMENEIGRIAPGLCADFVVMASSPFDAEVRWAEVKVSETWVEGKRVFRSVSR